MDQQATVKDIEERAHRAYSSIRAVCLRADVSPSTFARWKLTPGNPDPVAPNTATLKRLDKALKQIEAEARRKYAKRGKAVAA